MDVLEQIEIIDDIILHLKREIKKWEEDKAELIKEKNQKRGKK